MAFRSNPLEGSSSNAVGFPRGSSSSGLSPCARPVGVASLAGSPVTTSPRVALLHENFLQQLQLRSKPRPKTPTPSVTSSVSVAMPSSRNSSTSSLSESTGLRARSSTSSASSSDTTSASTTSPSSTSEAPFFSSGATGNGENIYRKERLICNLKRIVKKIMEESVMLKCIHEDSGIVTELVTCVDNCLTLGLKRRALGLFKTSSSTIALLQKVAKENEDAAIVLKKVAEVEQLQSTRRTHSTGDSVSRLSRSGTLEKTNSGSNLVSATPKHLSLRVALFEKRLQKVVGYLVSQGDRFYTKESVIADQDYGPLLSSILQGPCAVEYTKIQLNGHQWNELPANELVQRHKISSGSMGSLQASFSCGTAPLPLLSTSASACASVATSPLGRTGSGPALAGSLGAHNGVQVTHNPHQLSSPVHLNARRSLSHTSSLINMDEVRSLPTQAREYVESLHQNQRDTLVYGKNNVFVLPKDSAKPQAGYLSLHMAPYPPIPPPPSSPLKQEGQQQQQQQPQTSLCLKWTPNRLMNGTTFEDKSASWQQAVSVDMASILFMHCHQDIDDSGTLIMIATDGTQHPPLQFPPGGHLKQFLSFLEGSLAPHGGSLQPYVALGSSVRGSTGQLNQGPANAEDSSAALAGSTTSLVLQKKPRRILPMLRRRKEPESSTESIDEIHTTPASPLASATPGGSEPSPKQPPGLLGSLFMGGSQGSGQSAPNGTSPGGSGLGGGGPLSSTCSSPPMLGNGNDCVYKIITNCSSSSTSNSANSLSPAVGITGFNLRPPRSAPAVSNMANPLNGMSGASGTTGGVHRTGSGQALNGSGPATGPPLIKTRSDWFSSLFSPSKSRTNSTGSTDTSRSFSLSEKEPPPKIISVNGASKDGDEDGEEDEVLTLEMGVDQPAGDKDDAGSKLSGGDPAAEKKSSNRVSPSEPISTLCHTMRRQIITRAFYGWLSHCRHMRTVRQHLSDLAFHEPLKVIPESWSNGVKTEWWRAQRRILLGDEQHDEDERPAGDVFEGDFEDEREKAASARTKEQDRRARVSEIEQEIYKKVYFGGIEPCLRKQIWPYLLGHYKWHFRRAELEDVDRKTQTNYENKLSDWMAIEAIVRQRDKETTAANIAKLSGGASLGNLSSLGNNSFNMSNDVFESVEDVGVEDDAMSSRTVSADKISTITEVTENSTSHSEKSRPKLLSTQSEPGGSSLSSRSPSSTGQNGLGKQLLRGTKTKNGINVSPLRARELLNSEGDAEDLRNGGCVTDVSSSGAEELEDEAASMAPKALKLGPLGRNRSASESDTKPDRGSTSSDKLVSYKITMPSVDAPACQNPDINDLKRLTPRLHEGGKQDTVSTASPIPSPVSSDGGGTYPPELVENFALNLHRIDKDVQRCDRNLPYFTVANLEKLRNVITTYVWENLDVGYMQGMCDLVAPILVTFDDEALTHSCFSHLMERMLLNFPNYSQMDENFANMRSLMQVLDQTLYDSILQNGDFSHFYFCYRWFLLDYKREFTYHETYWVWETIWASSKVTSSHFYLFVALALVENYRDIILDRNMDFTDIIKFFNEMAEKHSAKDILAIARDLVFQLQALIAEE